MITFARVLFLLLLTCCGLFGSAFGQPGQWIVVVPPSFRAALEPLVEHRKAEGFEVAVLQTSEVFSPGELNRGEGAPLQHRLNELFQRYKGRSYVLLAGGYNRAGLTNAEANTVPALRGVVGRMKGEPSDCAYGLPGVDGLPSVAVGRLPARTAEELGGMVRKILAFEAESQPAPWRNRLVLLLGNPGAGLMSELYMRQSLAAHLEPLHPSWEMRTVFNVSSSPYYLPRPQDRDAALRYIQDGALFSIYLGHSGPEGLGLDGRFIVRKAFAVMSIPHGAGPFFTCGCFACQSDTKEDGFGLAAVRNPTGPVAVIGATGESFSAPGQLAVEGLLGRLTQPPFDSRLGEYWLGVQTGFARGKMDAVTFALLDAGDGTGGKVPLAAQRLETLEMWMLLGDPALRMPVVPVDIALHAAGPIACGKAFTVSGALPERLSGAAVRVTLERPLNSEPIELEPVPADSRENREARLRAWMTNHQRCNSFVLDATEVRGSGSSFETALRMPARVPWTNVVVRASATRSNEMALGTLVLAVRGAEGGAK